MRRQSQSLLTLTVGRTLKKAMWLQNWRSVPLGMMCRHTPGEVLVDHFEFFYSSVAFEVDLGVDKEEIL